jgi:hypothetical protein
MIALVSSYQERRRDRKREESEQFASKFSTACATAGFFGPEVAHTHGGHDDLIDPDCSLCVGGDRSEWIPEAVAA